MSAAPPTVPGPRGAAWARWVGVFLARIVWNTRAVGRSNVPTDGPFILAANHTGLMDGPVVVGVSPRPVHMLVKESMFTGAVGTFLHAAGQISVDQDGGRSALAAGIGVLRRGGGLGIFPEGNRGRGDVSTGHAGVAWLALNGKAQVVPVAVLGTRSTGQKVSALPRFRHRIHVEFGEPFLVERRPGTSGKVALEEANVQIREALSSLVVEAVARTGIALPADGPEQDAVV
ncbi:lysophospholipid acyltransferase family protein [Sanguibacter antarcticus]|uniref:1-acyl-sn-glycerol-3-phosphate acyltransferase n=1 Tax=Sanguibacter antarcticus TaxID=372484 RepID=A0A2A9E2S1_9MICO|nr:lysophospholipid acyltransferase family protein [Sanguibacter antarcticus]PFG33248.1 1-acyl-sn-glycerol-3-phosphate acyltransferase [Sanguibacter antarcticus]